MTKFLLIRHAITNAVGKHLSGRMEGVALNEEGRTQAQQLARRLAGLQVAAVYSSPLQRALETAEPIATSLNLEPRTNTNFLEVDFGEWTNRSFGELARDPVFHRFNSFRSHTRIPGGETMLEAQTRIVTGMQKLCEQHAGETIAIVSHSDLIKAAVAYYAGIHLDVFQRLEISPASVSIVDVYEETARIMLLNDTGKIMLS